VATDVYRPAAIDQLVKLGTKIEVPVYEEGTQADPVEIATRGVAKAAAEGYDAVIVDTAGRLQVGGGRGRRGWKRGLGFRAGRHRVGGTWQVRRSGGGPAVWPHATTPSTPTPPPRWTRA
jgi:hypothetical protein